MGHRLSEAGRPKTRSGEESDVEHRGAVVEFPQAEGRQQAQTHADPEDRLGRRPAGPGASMMPNTSVARPAIERTAPMGSSLSGCSSRDSGISSRVPTRPTATIGTFTRKTAFQEKFSSSAPPTIGPRTMPTPETAAHVAMARGRSASENRFVIRDSVAGISSAPPRPITPRMAIS